MSLSVEIAARHAFPKSELHAMHRLRAKAFRDRRGWDVTVLSGMEIDGFDAIEPYYMLLREESGMLCGCWRMLPTDGPYMLNDVFPELLGEQAAPQDPLASMGIEPFRPRQGYHAVRDGDHHGRRAHAAPSRAGWSVSSIAAHSA